MSEMSSTWMSALAELEDVLSRVPEDMELQTGIDARDEVLARYQPIFSRENISHLTEEDFTSFLHPKNNKHWNGFYRQKRELTADMSALRQALSILLDESRPIDERFDRVVSASMVKGLGKGLATAILLVAYPDRYGVWNNTSQDALKRIGIWPKFEPGTTLGKRYALINKLLRRLSHELGVDLWTLDCLLWGVLKKKRSEDATTRPETTTVKYGFPLEYCLHDFLWHNWENTELGRDWEICRNPGNTEAGLGYPTDAGVIDIPAKHKSRPEWLVVEIKKDQSADQVVGKILRYMGWVAKNLASPGESVRGLIIAPDVDRDLQYALAALPFKCYIQVMRYRAQLVLEPWNRRSSELPDERSRPFA